MTTQAKAHSLFDPAIVRRAIVDSFVKLDPRRQVRNPVMFTVYVGSILTTGLFVLSLRFGGEEPSVVHPRHLGLAVVHGAVRQLRRGDGRRARQGPGRRPAARPARRARQEVRPAARRSRCTSRCFRRCSQRGDVTVVPATDLRRGDVVFVEAGDYIPGRRRSDRRRRLGRRKRHHRRKRPGDPRKRRRPQRRHRRHARACPTGWSCASRPTPARRSWTA